MNNLKIKGLSSKTAYEYKLKGKNNFLVKASSKTKKQIIMENVFTYFNFVFLFLSILLILVGSFRDLTFLPIIISNSLIGIFQELKAKKILDNLKMLNTPVCKVIRDDNIIEVPIEDLVLDDVVEFNSGDQICADAVIVDGKVSVNESLITGESDEVNKDKDDELLSGSFVVSGKCFARLTKVGADSYISKLTLQAKKENLKEQSEIIRSLNKIVVFAGIVIIPIGISLFYQSYFINGDSIRESVRSMVASVIGMIPEGLFLLSSVALAISAMRLAKKKVLLHDMKSIETLAKVDVLCVDKTGTITDGNMIVETLEVLDNNNIQDVFSLICDFVYYQNEDNSTMCALKNHFNKTSNKEVIDIVSFSSSFKYSAVNFVDGSYVLGAPDFILKSNSKYNDLVDEYINDGLRVLVFGKCSYNVTHGMALKDVHPIAFIILSNSIRDTAQKTFTYFYEQNVNIKVLSGDNPVTVSKIALKAGIHDADLYMDASLLKTKKEMKEAILKYNIFGRVTPEQKKIFVNLLQEDGHTVAMTGDGVNDVLALKDADCSIAMASGSKAACETAQMVLLESDFSKMPSVVLEGRKVVNNLERSGSLFLVKNIFSLLTSVLAIYFGVKYPLTPAQVSFVSMFTIGIPAFFLSQIPNENLIRGKFITNIISKAVPGGITDTIMLCSMSLFGIVFNIKFQDISTSSTILLSIVGLMVLYSISKPMNKYKWFIQGGCTLGILLSFIFFSDYFGISQNMSLPGILLCINFSIMTEAIFRYVTSIFNFIKKIVLKIKTIFLKKSES